MSDAAKALFEACKAERIINEIRGWDRREWTEADKTGLGGTWQIISPGLTDKEKARYQRAAERLRL